MIWWIFGVAVSGLIIACVLYAIAETNNKKL